MRKIFLTLLLGGALSGCLATSKKENLGRPNFSQPRPLKAVAPVTTNESFSVVNDGGYVAVIGSRNFFVFKETHFQDLGPVQSATK